MKKRFFVLLLSLILVFNSSLPDMLSVHADASGDSAAVTDVSGADLEAADGLSVSGADVLNEQSVSNSNVVNEQKPSASQTVESNVDISNVSENITDIILPVTAEVYTKFEDSYTIIGNHGESAQINLKEYNGKTLYVVAKDVPQNIYFYCDSLVYTKFSIQGTEHAKIEAAEKNAVVTINSTIPVDTEFSVNGVLMLASYYVNVRVIKEIPDNRPLDEQLADSETLREMVQTMSQDEIGTDNFTAEDVWVIEEKMTELIRALDDPTDDEIDDYYFMMNQMLEVREDLGMCICGSSQNDHGFYCPLYVEYSNAQPAAEKMRMSKVRTAAVNDASQDADIYTNKWSDADNSGKVTLTMEAYATGITTTTKYIKPADMVIVVDQSASMLYADKPNLAGGIPTGVKGYSRTDLEDNEQAQKNASHGLYYMALGKGTLCFLVYKNNKWMYFDTFLSKTGSEHPSFPSHWGEQPKGYWHSCLEQACKSWEHMNNNLADMDDVLWSRFEKYGIYPTRYGSAYWALVNFLDNVSLKEVDHRISIVGFAGREENETETLCSLVKVSDQSGKDIVRAAIDELLCTGVSTHHDAGIALANDIFKNNTVDLQQRDRNLIFFSDGEGSSGTDDNKTLTASFLSKDTYGAKVYSVGTAAAPPALMEYLSSNYPDAQSKSNLGTKDKEGKYYFHASSASELNNIFAQLSSTVGSTTVELDENAYIKDVVTKYFVIPEGAGSIRAYTVACTGYSDGKPVWSTTRTNMPSKNITVNGNTVIVNGFDYSANYVSEGGRQEGTTDTQGDFHGRKLVVEIDIVPHEDFVGGNHVETNTSDSGLYDGNGNTVDKLPIPETDVKLAEIDLVVPDIYSYLGSDVLQCLTIRKIDRPFTLWRGEHLITLDVSQDDWGLSWQDDYADIDMVLVDEQGNEMTQGIPDIRKDTTYSVKITVAPKTAGIYQQNAESENGSIHVFYPELTFADQTYWYGEAVPASSELQKAFILLRWKNHKRGYSDGPLFNTGVAKMIGNIPEVNYTCTPDAQNYLPKTDVDVDVTVTRIGYIEESDLNGNVWFAWKACMPDCGRTIQPQEYGPKGDSPEFYLHMNHCRLTLTKTGGASDEPYVFNIYRNGAKYTQASITGNGSVTLYELPVGRYSAEEDAEWSWRYTPTISEPVTLNRENEEGTITCQNQKNINRWFNGFSNVVQNIFGQSNSTRNSSNE